MLLEFVFCWGCQSNLALLHFSLILRVVLACSHDNDRSASKQVETCMNSFKPLLPNTLLTKSSHIINPEPRGQAVSYICGQVSHIFLHFISKGGFKEC